LTVLFRACLKCPPDFPIVELCRVIFQSLEWREVVEI
uniref:Mlh1_C domain-containing protein n=1 Tax=Rodentolepis nana TaxID=102285 RepID=A0A0R3TEW8_RODNA